jgi:hypothetical protein
LNEPPHAAAVARYLAVRHEVVELAANDLVQPAMRSASAWLSR